MSYSQEESKNPLLIGKEYIYITYCMSGALFPSCGSSADELLLNAEITLHKVKQEKRARYAIFSLSDKKEMTEKLDFELQLARSIRNAHALAAGRRDLRTLRTITMDGEDAKDLDDAISIEKLPGKGYRLFVHIADVSQYVREATALDDEARLRGTSVYLVDRVIPMLPPRLSNGLCSLNPNTPRLALTAAMTVDYNGDVVDGDLYESIIESDARTSYTEVYGVLFEQKYLERYSDFIPMFETMKELKDILSAKRERRGALDFNFPETHVDLDEEGKPLSVYAYPINYANGIIEEFMILCNEFVASRFYAEKYPFVYRVHEDPDPIKIADFMHVAKLFGAVSGTKGKPTPRMLSSLMKQIEDEPYAPALSQILLRSLAKARYSEENLGHFGLASECYCHFTSPIRRYPDLYIHRIIKSFLHEENRKAYFKTQVTDVSDHSSVMERNSMDAERATVSQKVAEYMSRHIGDLYEGIISSIFHGGIFVQLASTVEGMIPFRTMNDYFEFEEKRLEARGKTSGQVYRIGDKVQVKVVNSDCILRRVDFELAEKIDGGRRKVRDTAGIKKDAVKGISKGSAKAKGTAHAFGPFFKSTHYIFQFLLCYNKNRYFYNIYIEGGVQNDLP